MIHFSLMQEAGLSVAAMSDKSDGDCGSRDEAVPNTEAFMTLAGAPGVRPVRVRQVHGIAVVCAEEARGASLEADGILLGKAGIAAGVSVADCAPVLLFDPLVRAGCLLHAGREGSFRNIAGTGVALLTHRFGSQPSSLVALIGPCAHGCCYEVSPELAAQWHRAGYACRDRLLDIPGTNSAQLEKAGVFRHNIHIVPHCTVCGGVFFSYRTDKTSNRNLVVMMV